ncbi:LAGLIDADG family homing endonuclease [uncultured Hyphomicrobium sp.]|uniref:LAGLIDADG family homing endonuclease n=1 Tax=uncultured Hyphomicrobium sp. TaxID=194373 RepID=UPI0025E6A339|nr:LAGLIDADG family homing endonuclease [uncultured Hyphomicrobium sp.]
MSGLNDSHAEWFTARKLCIETAVQMGVSSRGPGIAFDYSIQGKSLYAKVRDPRDKKFTRCVPSGVEQTRLWNEDCLQDDPQPGDSLIITEGEPDAIAVKQLGYQFVVSLPSGAANSLLGCQSKARKCLTIDVDGEPTLKPDVAKFKRVVVMVDGDSDGVFMRQAITEIIGEEYCWHPTYPTHAKDANDILLRTPVKVGHLIAGSRDMGERLDHENCGEEGLRAVIENARPAKDDGFIDFIAAEKIVSPLKPLNCGIPFLDPHFRPVKPSFIVIGGQAGHGKALALDTPIPTPSGWAVMADLRPGDVVFAEDGAQCNVVAVTEPMLGRPCYEVGFGTGEKIIADAEHEWLTETYLDRQSREEHQRPKAGGAFSRDQSHLLRCPTIKTTAEIASTLTYGAGSKQNHSIPLAGTIQCGHQEHLAMDPYLLGAWLGDGHSEANRITAHKDHAQHFIDAAHRSGFETSIAPSGGMAINIHIDPRKAGRARLSFGQMLTQLGVRGNKHIPPGLLRAEVFDRATLLRGLMDTDGSVRKADRVCEFTSVSERLARDVFDLVAGLGMKPTFLEGDAKLDGRVVSRKYRVCFTADAPVFDLPFKRDVQMAGTQSRNIGHRIVACRSVPSVPVKCIQVDSPSRMYLASRSYIPTHNSTITQAILYNLLWANEGLRASIFHAEGDKTIPIVRAKKFWKGKANPAFMSAESMAKRDAWLADRLAFISPPQGQLPTFEWLLWAIERQALYRKRNVFVIDPWNQIVHKIGPRASKTDYVGECIYELKRLCDRYGLIMIVAHHTTKAIDPRTPPSRYDLADSAHWVNASDHVLLGWKPDESENITRLEIAKSKDHEKMGTPGHVWVGLDAPTFAIQGRIPPKRFDQKATGEAKDEKGAKDAVAGDPGAQPPPKSLLPEPAPADDMPLIADVPDAIH